MMNRTLKAIAPLILVLYFSVCIVGPVWGEDINLYHDDGSAYITKSTSKEAVPATTQLTEEASPASVEEDLKQRSDKAFSDRMIYASVFSLLGITLANPQAKITSRNTGALYLIMGAYSWLFKSGDETRYDEYKKGNTVGSRYERNEIVANIVYLTVVVAASGWYSYQAGLDPTYNPFNFLLFDLLPSIGIGAYVGAYVGMGVSSFCENVLHLTWGDAKEIK